MTPKEVMALCRQKDVKAVDFRFADLLGAWHHLTIPVDKLNEDLFDDGLGFDGSSIRLRKPTNASDMLAVPQPDTAVIDPFNRLPTLSMICSIQDPITKEDYANDPRNICRKATDFLTSTGIADTANVGPEVEFFIFDKARFGQTARSGFYFLESDEAEWNRGVASPPNLGYKVRQQAGYAAVPPSDQLMDLGNEIMRCMIESGIDVQCQHHEAGSAGRGKIDLRQKPLAQMADAVMRSKHIVKNIARKHQKTATFMPKPIFGDFGSGMHIHFSLWKNNEPLFAGKRYAGLSETALYAIGGILRHAPALMAFTNPSTNSYKRLVPGFEAPVFLTYAQSNRSAACRIPMYSSNPRAKRLEVRFPDSSANPYLAFSTILMAAIDGIQNKLDPGNPIDNDLDELAAEIHRPPNSLAHALASLEKDHEFLVRGGVFTKELIESWIAHKREHDVRGILDRPHPYEFCMYFDA